MVLLSIVNPLHVLQKDLLAAAVIEFRGPAVSMAGDSLSGLKGAVIFQKIRDAGREAYSRKSSSASVVAFVGCA
jgi:hypothetical protein